jgi:hypothetical protein
MYSFRLSCLVALLAFACQGLSFGQIKNRDFTGRSGIEMKRFGGSKMFGGKPLSRIMAKRIHVSEIPFHYSPFGGKRFPSNRVNILQHRQYPTSKLNLPTIYGSSQANLSTKRVIDDLSNVTHSAAPAQEFRDKYAKSLDKRVDEWMRKVNNMSLAEVNRYQFRRGRSTKPGFPIQRAGAISPLAPTGKRLAPSTRPANPSQSPAHGWLGPSRTKVKGTSPSRISSNASPSIQRTRISSPPRSSSPPKSKLPSIRLGPPRISARAK